MGQPYRLPLDDNDQARLVQRAAFYFVERAFRHISDHEIA